jgi:hypothetical protein
LTRQGRRLVPAKEATRIASELEQEQAQIDRRSKRRFPGHAYLELAEIVNARAAMVGSGFALHFYLCNESLLAHWRENRTLAAVLMVLLSFASAVPRAAAVVETHVGGATPDKELALGRIAALSFVAMLFAELHQLSQ